MKRLLAIVCTLLLLVSLFSACNKTTENVAQSSDSVSGKTPGEPASPELGYTDGVDTYSATQDAATGEITPDTAEKIIYTATVNMETMDFSSSISAIEKVIKDFGGFVERSEISGDSLYAADGTSYLRNRYAFYTIRIPANELDKFLSQAGTLGNITSSNKSAQNVTSQYTDFEARLTSLQTQETRLLELVAEAEDIDALISLESKLAEVRYEIESIQRSLRDLDSKIAYSTVDLNIREVEVYQPSAKQSFWQRIADSFLQGWRSFVRGLGDFFVWLSSAIFPLLLICGIGTAGFFLFRKALRKRKAKKDKSE